MSLLTNLMEHPLDEGYAAVSRSGGHEQPDGRKLHPLRIVALIAV